MDAGIRSIRKLRGKKKCRKVRRKVKKPEETARVRRDGKKSGKRGQSYGTGLVKGEPEV